MDNFLRPIYQEHASNPNTMGILTIEKTQHDSPITDDFDMILLIVVNEYEKSWYVKHYEFDGKTAALHIVEENVLMEWIDTSGYRRAVEWIIYGKTVFDRNEYIAHLKEQLRDFPIEKRNLRKVIDFGKLIKSYSEAKSLYETREYKDSHSKILNSLHYLARLSVIEKGYYPEVTVWSQVKNIDFEVYKLYEEFIESNEEVDKRIELMIIAMDFIINNRAVEAAAHLLDLLKEGETAWSYADIKRMPSVQPYTFDLSSILSYLVEKNIIDTVQEETKGIGVFQRKYILKD
ncbi:nucleotidyltransferase-like protein [Oceanobacillus massiliensis]|uniref:nucleotidyltransferase-like protein n=1 Tax=Oceanobacillus massiliensis TaxID=1465765 RepID=UPI000288D127|nr:nucleotidyltransferase-like protein [Oceanobacillus massiliensis]